VKSREKTLLKQHAKRKNKASQEKGPFLREKLERDNNKRFPYFKEKNSWKNLGRTREKNTGGKEEKRRDSLTAFPKQADHQEQRDDRGKQAQRGPRKNYRRDHKQFPILEKADLR